MSAFDRTGFSKQANQHRQSGYIDQSYLKAPAKGLEPWLVKPVVGENLPAGPPKSEPRMKVGTNE